MRHDGRQCKPTPLCQDCGKKIVVNFGKRPLRRNITNTRYARRVRDHDLCESCFIKYATAATTG